MVAHWNTNMLVVVYAATYTCNCRSRGQEPIAPTGHKRLLWLMKITYKIKIEHFQKNNLNISRLIFKLHELPDEKEKMDWKILPITSGFIFTLTTRLILCNHSIFNSCIQRPIWTLFTWRWLVCVYTNCVYGIFNSTQCLIQCHISPLRHAQTSCA